MFNIINTIIFLPLIGVLAKLTTLIIRGREEEMEFHLKFIDNRVLNTPPIALGQARAETKRMAQLSEMIDETVLFCWTAMKNGSSRWRRRKDGRSAARRSPTSGGSLPVHYSRNIQGCASMMHMVNDLGELGIIGISGGSVCAKKSRLHFPKPLWSRSRSWRKNPWFLAFVISALERRDATIAQVGIHGRGDRQMEAGCATILTVSTPVVRRAAGADLHRRAALKRSASRTTFQGHRRGKIGVRRHRRSTNTVRLLLVEVGAGKILLFATVKSPGRVYPDKGLAPESWSGPFCRCRVSTILRGRGYPRPALSARSAARCPEWAGFHCQGRSETGLHIEIIDGEEEARLCAQGCWPWNHARKDAVPTSGSTEFLLQAARGTLFIAAIPWGRNPQRKFGTLVQQDRIRQVLDSTVTWPIQATADGALRRRVFGRYGWNGDHAGRPASRHDRLRLAAVNNLSLDHPTGFPAVSPEHFRRLREALPGMEKEGDLIVPGLHRVEIMASWAELFDRERFRTAGGSRVGTGDGTLIS
jgi:hypothetical protein